jgi:LmbE family N-acetylglucosaminyl deacetylase
MAPARTQFGSMTLLGVWAHPDDESYLSAALMHRVVSIGGRVVVVTATRGEQGGAGADRHTLAELRERELRAAMSILGVTDVRFLGYADGECSSVDDDAATAVLTDIINEIQPDLIVTFGPDGITGHPDHLAVSRWTTIAERASGRERLLYATMTDQFLDQQDDLHSRLGVWMEGVPQPVAEDELELHLVPTPNERALKFRALRAHASQILPLIEMIGGEAFDGWWVDEFFRAPTAAEWSVAELTRGGTWLAR